ncbi:hypothetical protein [Arthrobacter sp. zg-Y750]|uniref:hypothetical protein n=1 Tax=Arthrobacter sp. zg-Y750 TaxID=2894189 RepID=UPI001E322B44|nr:hypothetical protein [Arthrobacter sp. zg-Y750]MCC9176730.1 hypothetical protein [Arthrobacter sp. zg-Y750]
MSTTRRVTSGQDLVLRPESGRSLPAVLTPEGTDLLARAEAVVDTVDRRMVSGLSDGQAKALAQALGACMEALEEA